MARAAVDTPRCARCGRRLRSPRSTATGLGPVCRRLTSWEQPPLELEPTIRDPQGELELP